jgi:hypothetical protein
MMLMDRRTTWNKVESANLGLLLLPQIPPAKTFAGKQFSLVHGTLEGELRQIQPTTALKRAEDDSHERL